MCALKGKDDAPELCVQTPLANSSGISWLRLKLAPRNLNAPPFCRFSALKYRILLFGREADSVDEVKIGVRCIAGLMTSWACSIETLDSGSTVE